MGHYIPTFFFPISEREADQPFDSWNDAVPLLEKHLNKDGGVWEVSSENKWHQLLLANLSNSLRLDGLEFIATEAEPRRLFGPNFRLTEIACLNPAEIDHAFNTIDALIAALPGAMLDCRIKVDADVERLRASGYETSFGSAAPSKVVDLPPASVENPDAWSFGTFLKSLHQALGVARVTGEHFLYICPTR